MNSNSWISSWLNFLGTEITGLHHYTQPLLNSLQPKRVGLGFKAEKYSGIDCLSSQVPFHMHTGFSESLKSMFSNIPLHTCHMCLSPLEIFYISNAVCLCHCIVQLSHCWGKTLNTHNIKERLNLAYGFWDSVQNQTASREEHHGSMAWWTKVFHFMTVRESSMQGKCVHKRSTLQRHTLVIHLQPGLTS